MSDAPDRQLLDRLVREHLGELMRLAVRLTGDLDIAEDVLQDALAAVARAWSKFREDASFRTWATRIVINAFRDHLRRNVAIHSLKPALRDLAELVISWRHGR